MCCRHTPARIEHHHWWGAQVGSRMYQPACRPKRCLPTSAPVSRRCNIVGTRKGRFTRLEQALLEKQWQAARPDVKVKLGELYVFAESVDRIAKKRALRRRQLKWLAVGATVQARNHGTDARCLVDEARQCADAKDVIYCAPISWSPIQPSRGATTCNWCRWSKRLGRSKATCPFGRFTTKKSAASKPTF